MPETGTPTAGPAAPQTPTPDAAGHPDDFDDPDEDWPTLVACPPLSVHELENDRDLYELPYPDAYVMDDWPREALEPMWDEDRALINAGRWGELSSRRDYYLGRIARLDEHLYERQEYEGLSESARGGFPDLRFESFSPLHPRPVRPEGHAPTFDRRGSEDPEAFERRRSRDLRAGIPSLTYSPRPTEEIRRSRVRLRTRVAMMERALHAHFVTGKEVGPWDDFVAKNWAELLTDHQLTMMVRFDKLAKRAERRLGYEVTDAGRKGSDAEIFGGIAGEVLGGLRSPKGRTGNTEALLHALGDGIARSTTNDQLARLPHHPRTGHPAYVKGSTRAKVVQLLGVLRHVRGDLRAEAARRAAGEREDGA